MVRTCGEVVQVAPGCRALGSSSDPQGGVGGAESLGRWQEEGVWMRRWGRAGSGARLQCPPLQ